jgi:hypothetical protein
MGSVFTTVSGDRLGAGQIWPLVIGSPSHFGAVNKTTDISQPPSLSSYIAVRTTDIGSGDPEFDDWFEVDLTDIPDSGVMKTFQAWVYCSTNLLNVIEPNYFFARIMYRADSDFQYQIRHNFTVPSVAADWLTNQEGAVEFEQQVTGKQFKESAYLQINFTKRAQQSAFATVYAIVLEFTWSTANLAALHTPFTRIGHLLVPSDAGMVCYRMKPSETPATCATYAVTSDSTDTPVGIVQIAGRLYSYFYRSSDSTNYAIISDKDGTEWLEADLASLSDFSGYTLKHISNQARTQYAVLSNGSDSLYFSRNVSGDTTSWETPSLIVDSLSADPTASIVPQADGTLRVYYQTGSDTPATLLCSKDNGGSWS